MATKRVAVFKANRIKPGAGGRRPGIGLGGVTKIRRTYDVDWDNLRIQIFERDNYQCRRCDRSLRGTNRRHVHHIKPLSKGGSNNPSNLISLCDICHHHQHKHSF